MAATRRQFMAAAGAFAAGSIAGPVPWEDGSRRLKDEGTYCYDFEAFEIWWQDQANRFDWSSLDSLELLDRIALYSIISDLYRKPMSLTTITNPQEPHMPTTSRPAEVHEHRPGYGAEGRGA